MPDKNSHIPLASRPRPEVVSAQIACKPDFQERLRQNPTAQSHQFETDIYLLIIAHGFQYLSSDVQRLLQTAKVKPTPSKDKTTATTYQLPITDTKPESIRYFDSDLVKRICIDLMPHYSMDAGSLSSLKYYIDIPWVQQQIANVVADIDVLEGRLPVK